MGEREMRSLGNTPIIDALVRNEFLFDQKQGRGEFTGCYIMGFCAVPGRVPSFQIMLENGSQWARVPIHMLVTEPCDPLPLADLVYWDCYGYEFEVVRLDFLRGMRCRNVLNAAVVGSYVFTVDWLIEGFSEIPDQHKNHHVIALESGHIAAWPNNRVQWLDPSWIKPIEGNPGYQANSHAWSVGA